MVKTQRRLDEKSSKTAGFTCMCRAVSNLSGDPYYKSDDHVAPRLLPRAALFAIRSGLMNVRSPLFPTGMLEYVIARTRYMDNVVRQELDSEIDQVVIFGAGFDSRASRFAHVHPATTFFELDTHHTQEAKLRQFEKRGIPSPPNTAYIPVDFNVDPARETILHSGFDPGRRTLFILEGLIMYLEREAVDDLFVMLYELCPPGSVVVFDYVYASVLRQENLCYGERSIYRTVNSVKEAWRFGLEPGQIDGFARRFGFRLIENLTPEEMDQRYFTDESNKRRARVNGTHCLARIEK